jgi:two-component system sensor histidine kinase YesM
MTRLFSKFNNLTLKNKLIIAFIGFIVIPVMILGFFLIKFSSETIQDMAIKSAVQSNEQVIKNLDTFLEMLSKLTEYPLSDSDINKIMLKNHSQAQYPEYEKIEDFTKVNTFAYTKIKSFSNMIDSVVLYDINTNRIYGRSPTDYLNKNYADNTFQREEWLKKIIELEGEQAIIGVHQDLLLALRGDYVVSVGRSIVEPYSKKNLGVIIINTGVEKLEKLWMDMKITNNSKFYLVDENNNIIYSKNKAEINKNINQILGKKISFEASYYNIDNSLGQKAFLISSVSKISGWKAVTIIPKNELFSYITVMFRITIVSISIGIILSIIIAIFIATGITRPLYELNQKMKQVGEGNLNINIDINGGEVGEISKTVQKMLNDIKRLINKIYKEEMEKRNAEMLALQSQINPHFIYNTLNVIKWMAHIQGVTGIENALTSLSSLLSFTAKSRGDFVPVEEEVKFIQDYLKILNIRYYNKFTVSYEINKEVYQYKTLKFLLQPVIENAVFHGFEGLQRKGLLKISIDCESDKIIFKVEDNGNGMTDNMLSSIFQGEENNINKKFNSIGLSNVQKRIKLHFGEQYGLYADSILGQGTIVTIVVPAIGIEA